MWCFLPSFESRLTLSSFVYFTDVSQALCNAIEKRNRNRKIAISISRVEFTNGSLVPSIGGHESESTSFAFCVLQQPPCCVIRCQLLTFSKFRSLTKEIVVCIFNPELAGCLVRAGTHDFCLQVTSRLVAASKAALPTVGDPVAATQLANFAKSTAQALGELRDAADKVRILTNLRKGRYRQVDTEIDRRSQ